MSEPVRRGAYARHPAQAPRPAEPEPAAPPPEPPPAPPEADPWPRCKRCHQHPVTISIDGGRSGWCWCCVPTE